MPYFDSAATTKPIQDITNIIKPYISGDKWYNPSSLYKSSTKVKEDIECVRENISNLVNANSKEIYFTSGAAESNNWALQGFVNKTISTYANDDGNRGHAPLTSYNPVIITSEIEHKSIMDCVEGIANRPDVTIVKIHVDNNGFIDIDELNNTLRRYSRLLFNKILVSIQYANSEIGVIQDIKKIAELVHKYNGIFHTDATQILPHAKVNVKDISIDMMSASAQKMGGLKGTGFLYINENIKDNIAPLIYGSQERDMRGGTENVIGIIAMGGAVKHLDYDNINSIIQNRDNLINELENIGCNLVGSRTNRLPNNVCVVLPEGISGESMLYTLDLAGIMVSVGSACNSHSVKPSHVLKAMGYTDDEAYRAIRISISEDTTKKDIDNLVREIKRTIAICSYVGEDYGDS